MATIMIGYVPELTVERAMYLFGQQFAGKYNVRRTNVLKRDFVVRKTGWAGVGLRLKQEKARTTFVFTGMMPNMLLQTLFGGLASYLFLRSTWREMEAEVADFIVTCSEFQPRQSVAAVPPVQPVEAPPVLPELAEAAGAPTQIAAAKPKAAKAGGARSAKPKTSAKTKAKTSRSRQQPRKRKAA